MLSSNPVNNRFNDFVLLPFGVAFSQLVRRIGSSLHGFVHSLVGGGRLALTTVVFALSLFSTGLITNTAIYINNQIVWEVG